MKTLNTRYSLADEDFIRELYAEVPIQDLARELNRSVTSIRSKAYQLGLNGSEPRKTDYPRDKPLSHCALDRFLYGKPYVV